jgi:hypothetical protein
MTWVEEDAVYAPFLRWDAVEVLEYDTIASRHISLGPGRPLRRGIGVLSAIGMCGLYYWHAVRGRSGNLRMLLCCYRITALIQRGVEFNTV